MKVTSLSATEFDVQAESLSCTRLMCHFITRSAQHKPGDACPRCERNQANVGGVLQCSTYRVDIAARDGNGVCGCFHFERKLSPELDRMSRTARLLFRRRCKHLLAARKFAKEDAQFDALLAALPDQEEQI